MRQVIRKGIKDIIVDEVPDPMVTPHQVLIRPVYSLISSGTETASIHTEGALKEVANNPSHIGKVLNVMKAQGPMRTVAEVMGKFSEYAVIGYSGAGLVAAKHATVKDLEIGSRVAYGGEGTGHGELITTGRNLVARMPEEVGFDTACFATLGSIAMNGVRTAGIGLGDSVAVIGQGLVGQLVGQLARLQGGVVTAIDLRGERVELARSLGAPHGVAGEGAVEGVMNVTGGRGADVVIIAAAAKSDGPCRTALEMVRDRGKIVIVGAVNVTFDWYAAYLKEVQVLMSRAYGPGSYDPAYEREGQDYPLSYVRWTENRNMEEFQRLIGTGQVNVGPLVTHRFALEEAPKAYETIMAPGSSSLAVLLKYREETVREPMKHRVEIVPTPAAVAGALGVALVGAGGLARWAHLPVVKEIKDAKMRAVHSASGARGKGYALRWGADYCTTDLEEIWKDAGVHVVIITSRNQHHARQVVAALEAGKHVFVEKPMALTMEECRAIARASRASGKWVTVGFNRRFAPYYVELKKQLKRRSSPAVISCRVNSPGISGSYWMADPAIGGAILGEACHFVDLFYWLLDSEAVSVSAYTLPRGEKEPIGENSMTAVFRFADGSIASLAYSTMGTATSGGELVEVFAQGVGAATEDFKRLAIKGKIARTWKKMWPAKGYDAQLKAFFEAIRTGKEPGVTEADGIRATVGCLRMLESARDLEPKSMAYEDVLAG